jgi:hypothetical protein
LRDEERSEVLADTIEASTGRVRQRRRLPSSLERGERNRDASGAAAQRPASAKYRKMVHAVASALDEPQGRLP